MFEFGEDSRGKQEEKSVHSTNFELWTVFSRQTISVFNVSGLVVYT